MKKTKLLIPILTIGTLGAVVTPMTVLTSCHKTNTGKDANLVNGYDCSVQPLEADKAKFANADAALNAYINAVQPASNEEYGILKDDARYAYSLGLKSENFKKIGSYKSYTLDFENVDIPEGTKKMKVTFAIKLTGGSHGDESAEYKIRNADIECKFTLDDAMDLEFHEADDTTWEKKNYIACIPTGTTAKYWLSGKCTVNDKDYTIENKERTCDITKTPGSSATEAEVCAYMAKEFVLTGLTCNYKDIGEGNKGGALYTNYFTNAKIGA